MSATGDVYRTLRGGNRKREIVLPDFLLPPIPRTQPGPRDQTPKERTPRPQSSRL